MVKQRDGAEERESQESVEQATCEKMHVSEEGVCERVVNTLRRKRHMVRWRKARINVSDVESCLTKEDSQLVRSLMKREISDDVHQQVCQMKSLQVRTSTIKVRKRRRVIFPHQTWSSER